MTVGSNRAADDELQTEVIVSVGRCGFRQNEAALAEYLLMLCARDPLLIGEIVLHQSSCEGIQRFGPAISHEATVMIAAAMQTAQNHTGEGHRQKRYENRLPLLEESTIAERFDPTMSDRQSAVDLGSAHMTDAGAAVKYRPVKVTLLFAISLVLLFFAFRFD